MNEVAQALAPNNLLVWAWRLVVWVCAAGLLALGALVFIRPAVVHRFIDGFVASQRIDFLEVAVRLIVSLALVAVSPETKLPLLFFWLGAGLAITAIPMMFLHRFQRRQAVWAVPFAKRILPLMGVSGIALGGLIVWALSGKNGAYPPRRRLRQIEGTNRTPASTVPVLLLVEEIVGRVRHERLFTDVAR